MPIAFLLAAFIAVPLAEIAMFIAVGGRIGLGWTLLLVVLTAAVGVAMLRRQGFAVLDRARRELEQDRLPVSEVFEGFCLVIAGALLLTPGFLTDGVGALLLVPAVRTWLYGRVRRRIELHVARAHAEAAAGGGAAPRPGPVIEGEFEEVDPERHGEADRRRDGPREMPPPRGGWDQQP
jgi:UPF0716 protein FxsA